MVSTKTKYQAVVKTFGVPVDPEDVDFIDFMYARRHLATVPEGGWRELAYIIEVDEMEHAITSGLDRIRARDGDRICKEAASYLRKAVDLALSARHQARTKANEAAAAHV